MKVLVTGGRDFQGIELVDQVLSRLHSESPITLLIHGDASGADTFCGRWAESIGIPVKKCPADWKKHGRAAGPIRNGEMLKLLPELLVAFPGGRGTANMVMQARSSGVRVVYAESSQ